MLDGLRVLDLSRVIAGPYCAMLLADLGADVIKLERPGHGDDLRGIRGREGMSSAFAAINRSKRGIAVDLQHPDGRRIAFDLARRTDVLIENFVPGVAERLGLGYDAVQAANPAVVYASISGFGQTGPYRTRPSYNSIAMGMSGIMSLTGMPGQPPTRPGGSISDLAAALMAFGAINAALVHRLRTGAGQHVDVSLLASTMALLPDPIAHYFESGRRPERVGNRNPYLTPAEAFQAADGFVVVVITGPAQWPRFCKALGDATLAADPRFATNEARLANHAAFKARVEAVLTKARTADWVQRFESHQVAAGPVYELDEVFQDPQVRDMDLVTEVDQPGWGPVRFLGFPFRASATPARIRRPAPQLGEHTAEVLAEIGLSRDEVARLEERGVIATRPALAAER